MGRAIWSGSISFGLVNVPVKLYTAVRDHAMHFHQVDKASGSRIRYEKIADKTGEEVDSADIELGYEISKGRMVVVDPEELAALRPRTTRTIDITDFVELSQIDPVFYNRTYWMAPDGEGAERAYRLLVAAMEDRGKVGIGMVVMRNKQYLAAIRPREGALALSTMRFADEVLPPSSVDPIPAKPSKPPAKELRLATQIIDSLSANWDPSGYHDTFTEEVQELIKRHDKGEDIVMEVEEPAEQATVTDLMKALQASLEANRKTSGSAARTRSGTTPKRSGRPTPTQASRPASKRAGRKKANAGKVA
jgi:DNA end-binding protein Ku